MVLLGENQISLGKNALQEPESFPSSYARDEMGWPLSFGGS